MSLYDSQNLLRARGALPVANSGHGRVVLHEAEGFVGAILSRIVKRLRDLLQAWRREHEIDVASARLRALTDAQLRDMGITRADIPRVVRYGRDGL